MPATCNHPQKAMIRLQRLKLKTFRRRETENATSACCKCKTKLTIWRLLKKNIVFRPKTWRCGREGVCGRKNKFSKWHKDTVIQRLKKNQPQTKLETHHFRLGQTAWVGLTGLNETLNINEAHHQLPFSQFKEVGADVDTDNSVTVCKNVLQCSVMTHGSATLRMRVS